MRLTRQVVPLLCTWAIYLLAWAVPVVKDGVALPDGLPGLQALAFAMQPYGTNATDTWWSTALSMSTGLTNLVMVSSVVILWPPFRKWANALAGAGLASFLLNSSWYLNWGDDRGDLRAGYFLWWVSFLLMSLAAFRLGRPFGANSHAA